MGNTRTYGTDSARPLFYLWEWSLEKSTKIYCSYIFPHWMLAAFSRFLPSGSSLGSSGCSSGSACWIPWVINTNKQQSTWPLNLTNSDKDWLCSVNRLLPNKQFSPSLVAQQLTFCSPEKPRNVWATLERPLWPLEPLERPSWPLYPLKALKSSWHLEALEAPLLQGAEAEGGPGLGVLPVETWGSLSDSSTAVQGNI